MRCVQLVCAVVAVPIVEWYYALVQGARERFRPQQGAGEYDGRRGEVRVAEQRNDQRLSILGLGLVSRRMWRKKTLISSIHVVPNGHASAAHRHRA